MNKQIQLTVRMNPDLYHQAKEKCEGQFGIGLSPLIKVFLKAFVSQRGVGFCIGDQDLAIMFNHWLGKKEMERKQKGHAPLPGPRLKDLYELGL
ncbi:hypothetical protein IPG41_06660 [Candidatus Peregrinibacteria bacterium]|nr:MAG: hypothetical protein IPG41_06660 [Candidatus Peregrinibacteria bacterium]